MITAQDIREKTFEKSRLNGYDMASVDDFLEELADDITASQKENAVLKSKMKVLVDKIEEYRANEEALNMAILSAQKLAVQIENDARQRASAMLAEADEQVKAKVGAIEEQTAIEERRLADAKAATASFFDGIRALCNNQLQNLDAISKDILPEVEPAAAAPAADTVEDAIRSIESNVASYQPDPAFNIDLTPAEETVDEVLKSFESTQPFTV
ncbi:MAG: DivIVA domain-containing protein [Oscillospiraceae bacterium]|nr:DivIVA domain-containing protein [Oscillospiraceae bacterium]